MYTQYRKAGTLHEAFGDREQCYSADEPFDNDRMPDDVEFLRRVYALFNGRDIEIVLAAMHPEVVRAN